MKSPNHSKVVNQTHTQIVVASQARRLQSRIKILYVFYVDDRGIDFTVDTGSEVTILNHQSSRDLILPLVEPTKMLVGADMSTLGVVGKSSATLANKGLSVPCVALS